jgi:hypothetical protein
MIAHQDTRPSLLDMTIDSRYSTHPYRLSIKLGRCSRRGRGEPKCDCAAARHEAVPYEVSSSDAEEALGLGSGIAERRRLHWSRWRT